MNKLLIIIQREYLAMVASRSFIVMTLLMPVIILACGLIPLGIAYLNDRSGDQLNVTVIDQSSRHYGAALRSNSQFRYTLLSAQPAESVNARQFHDKAGGSTDAIVVIPAAVDRSLEVSVYSDNTISAALKDDIGKALNDTISAARIAAHHIPQLQRIIDESQVQVNIDGIKWADDGSESASSTEVAMMLGMVLSLLIYMFVLSYGTVVMNSVIDEKTNRIMEVMVSSCKPFQLMMGKIVGVGLAGLTQFVAWIILVTVIGGAALTACGLGSLAMGGAAPATAAGTPVAPEGVAQALQAVMSINYAYVIVFFVLFFIGGYLLYASLFSAMGSAVDQASDASQFVMPLMIVMIIALYAGMACVNNPNGDMALWTSMIPFTSPVVMMVRLPYEVPLWQVLASLVLLYATAAAMVWLSARIYRTGILLYGKKRTFAEMARWIFRR